MATFTQFGINKLKAWLKDNLLLLLTFTGVLGGFIMGLLLRSFNLSNESILLIAYPGELFMRLLKLMILPLIIASLITGAASLNAKMNGMIALRTIMYFIATSLISACVGLILVIVIHPGSSEVKTLLGSGWNKACLLCRWEPDDKSSKLSIRHKHTWYNLLLFNIWNRFGVPWKKSTDCD